MNYFFYFLCYFQCWEVCRPMRASDLVRRFRYGRRWVGQMFQIFFFSFFFFSCVCSMKKGGGHSLLGRDYKYNLMQIFLVKRYIKLVAYWDKCYQSFSICIYIVWEKWKFLNDKNMFCVMKIVEKYLMAFRKWKIYGFPISIVFSKMFS